MSGFPIVFAGDHFQWDCNSIGELEIELHVIFAIVSASHH